MGDQWAARVNPHFSLIHFAVWRALQHNAPPSAALQLITLLISAARVAITNPFYTYNTKKNPPIMGSVVLASSGFQ